MLVVLMLMYAIVAVLIAEPFDHLVSVDMFGGLLLESMPVLLHSPSRVVVYVQIHFVY